MPDRIQLRRSKGWRKPPGAVVVARPSRWGNPLRMSDVVERRPGVGPERARAIVVDEFRDMLATPGARDRYGYPSDEEIRRHLGGHDLACWCPIGGPCHGEVLLEIANR